MDESREVRMFEPGDFVKFVNELLAREYPKIQLENLLDIMDTADKYSRKVKVKSK